MEYADLHCDTLRNLAIHGFEGDLLENGGHLDLKRMDSVGATLQMFACFTDVLEKGETFETTLKMVDYFQDQLKRHSKHLQGVYTAGDLAKPGIKGILAIEDGGVIEFEEARLDLLFQMGVRSITLTWNSPNSLGYPNHRFQYHQSGLTTFGKTMVEKMGALGIAVDVSHLSDQGFWDVADILKGPFIASHSNARSIHHHSRNLTDPMIRTIAERGGVIGLNFFSQFIDGTERMTIEGLLKHFDHIYQVGGSEVLAMGSDFDGIDCSLELEGIQGIPMLEMALEKRGYPGTHIEKAFFRNAYRALGDILPSK